MITCQDDLIQMYVEGDLQPAEVGIVEAHLAVCEQCRRRVAFYRGLFWDLAHADRLVPAPGPEAGTEPLAEALQAGWLKAQRREPVGSGVRLAGLWLTANPVFTGPAQTVGRAVSWALTGLGPRLFGRRGGGRR